MPHREGEKEFRPRSIISPTPQGPNGFFRPNANDILATIFFFFFSSSLITFFFFLCLPRTDERTDFMRQGVEFQPKEEEEQVD
jgi:hypothetical protein